MAKKKSNQASSGPLLPESLWGFFIFGFAFILYANTLSHDYTLDDHYVIKGNWMVEKGVSGIPDLMTTDYWEGPLGDNKVSKLYRPLSLVTFAIEYSIWGFKPSNSHFVNVLLFALTCLMLFRFLRLFFSSWPPWFPLIITLLFAAHPLHTESVANLKGRAEIMGALFMFLSLWLMLKWMMTRKTSLVVYSVIAFFAGLLSKEDSITFLAVVPLVVWFKLNEDDLKKAFKRISFISLPYLFATGLMLLLRNLFADESGKEFSYIENPLATMTGWDYILNAFKVTGDYILQLILPVHLVHDYSYNQIELADGLNFYSIFGFVILAACLGFGIVWSLQKKMEGFALLFFLITFSVASNLFVTIGVIKAERLMFVPLLGVMLFLSLLSLRLIDIKGWKHSLLMFIPGLLIPVYVFITIDRNKDWKDNETLLAADIDKCERNVKVMPNYAAILRNKAVQSNGPERERLLNESFSLLWQTTRIAPDYNRPWIDLGYLYEIRGKIDSAVYVFNRALELNPSDQNLVQRISNLKVTIDTAFIRGNDLINQNRLPEAIAVYDSLVKVYPNNFETWFYLGGVSFNTGQYPKALDAWEKAKRINPNDPRIDEPLGHARQAVKAMNP